MGAIAQILVLKLLLPIGYLLSEYFMCNKYKAVC